MKNQNEADLMSLHRIGKDYVEALEYRRNMAESIFGFCQLNLTKSCVEELIVRGENVLSEELKDVVDYKTRVSYFFDDIHLSEKDNEALSLACLIDNYKQGHNSYATDYWAVQKLNKEPIWVHVEANVVENPETKELIAFIYYLDITKEQKLQGVMEGIIRFEYDYVSTLNIRNKHFDVLAAKKDTIAPPEFVENYDEGMDTYIRQIVLPEECILVAAANEMITVVERLEKVPVYSFEFSMKEYDGQIRRKQIRYFYSNKEMGIIIKTRSDIDDIVHEEKQKQKQLSMALDSAERANNAKNEFMSHMSHDIRTPMNGIIGMTSIAKEACHEPEVADCLEKIDVSSKFLLGLINDILDISRIESGQFRLNPQLYYLEDFSRSLDTTIGPLMKQKKIAFKYELDCGLKLIFTDITRFNQIFFNLLSNAAKYTPECGSVSFYAEHLRMEGKYAWTRFYVRDNGIGMSENFLLKAFEPFEQEKLDIIQQWQGTGLGLSIVRKVVVAMGGKLSANSQLGMGTEVIVDMPLQWVNEDEYKQTKKKMQSHESLKGKKILLVEDNDINTLVAERLLESRGMQVTHAVNGRQGLDLFSKSREYQFDAILMDIRMPEMNGLDAARAIRELTRVDADRIPIIAMTANAYESDVQASKAAGMNIHLSKPVDPELLFDTLEKLLKEK